MSEKKKGGFFNASARDGVHYKTAKLWELIFSSAGNGTNICFYMLMMYASYIGSEGYGIATAVVGIIITGTRLFDAVTDSLIAIIFERFPTKHGRLRPFFVIGWIIEALSVFMMFDWAAGKLDGAAGFFAFIGIYIVYICGYTINNVAKDTADNIITNDPSQRPMMGFFKMCFSYGAPIIFQNVITFAILPRYDNQWNMPMLKEACYLFAFFGLVFCIMACLGVWRHDTPEAYEVVRRKKEGEKENKVSVREMLNVLTQNKDCQRYIVTVATDKFAQTTSTQSVITTMLNGILIGSYAASTMVNNLGSVIGLSCAFVGGLIITRTGAKKATVTWSYVCMGLNVGMIILCVVLGANGMSAIGKMGSVPFIIYALLFGATTAAKMVLTTAANVMRADVVDGEEYRSGNFVPSVVAGVFSLVDKAMSSICSTVATVAVSLIGYKTTMPQMGDPITPALFWLTMVLSFGLPIFGWVCNLLAMRNYTLSKEHMVEVQKANAERREAVKAEQTA